MSLSSRLSHLANTVLLPLIVLSTTLLAPASNAQDKTVDPLAYLVKPEVDAEVTRSTDNALTIHWTIPAHSVDVFAGTRPDAIDHTRSLAHVEGKQEVTLRDLSPTERFYFELKFTGGPRHARSLIVAERFLPLQGAANFRDIGGYSAAHGHHVRWGLAYRSEGFSKLTPSDLDYIADNVRLHLVCDLRGPSEVAAAPDLLLPEASRPETIHLPIDSNGAGFRKMLPVVLKGETQAIDDLMSATYIDMVDSHGSDVFGPVLAELADTKNLPLVTHCTAGKDRTGIATALLLTVLGVPRKTVVAEFTLSNLAFYSLMAELKDNKALAALGLNSERLGPIMVVKSVWIERTLDHIQKKYGSVDGYLKTAGKLDDATLAKIRANLLQ